jgi:O-antigen ligase
MVQTDPVFADQLRSQPRHRFLIAVALAFAACAILFRLPEPGIRVNHPFRVEFLFALCLLVFLITVFRRRTAFFDKPERTNGLVLAGIGAFIGWSLISMGWAGSAGSVAHHTLIWMLYGAIFLIFSGVIRYDKGSGFPLTVFAAISVILGLLCIFDYATTTDFAINEGPIRIRYGKYAEMLVTLSPLVWAGAIYAARRTTKTVLAAAAGLGWLTVMLSLSKGAFLAGIGGFVLFFLGSLIFSHRGFRKQIAIAALCWLPLTVGTQVISSAFAPLPATADYITGAADPSRETSTMRLFTWGVSREMIAANLIVGVGADNFGLEFNKARKEFRLKNPDTPKAEIGEDYLVERAHNEPLQILAELGVIGIALFLVPFTVFAYYFAGSFRRNGFRLSPIGWAAIAGMSAFAASSMVSSFSFRSVQNGAVFFVVMAIAVSEISKPRDDARSTTSSRFSTLAYTFCLMAALATGIYCFTKINAEYHAYQSGQAESEQVSEKHLASALAFDSSYAGVYFAHALKAAHDKQPARSAEYYRAAITNGLGTAPIYAGLAKQQIAANDLAAADATYRESIGIYPRSVFLRISYAVFLEYQRRQNDAETHLITAAEINDRQANGWYELIRNGSMAAFQKAQKDNSIAPPAELLPESAVRQFLDEYPGTQ